MKNIKNANKKGLLVWVANYSKLKSKGIQLVREPKMNQANFVLEILSSH